MILQEDHEGKGDGKDNLNGERLSLEQQGIKYKLGNCGKKKQGHSKSDKGPEESTS